MNTTFLDEDEVELSRDDALPCPFCGRQPTIQPWHGGGPRKRMVGCGSNECCVNPGVCGASRKTALANWNQRQ